MSVSYDVFENTSEQLSTVIADVLDDEAIAQPADLASVREAILAKIQTATVPLNRFADDQLQQLRDEVDALIEEYGADTPAVGFLNPWSSAALSSLIEAACDAAEGAAITLEGLFEAAERGLLADLVGQGEIADDEVQSVLSELRALVERHGPDRLAIDFIREP